MGSAQAERFRMGSRRLFAPWFWDNIERPGSFTSCQVALPGQSRSTGLMPESLQPALAAVALGLYSRRLPSIDCHSS